MSDELERKASELEGIVRNLAQAFKERESLINELLAKAKAHDAILVQIAAQLGVTPEQFRANYDGWYLRYKGRRLDDIEKASEALAAQLDDRSPSEVDVGEPIPPLFPDEE